MARGGNQPPRKPATVSGPGALSKRTDGNIRTQPINVPNVGDSEELQTGDRQRLEASQRVAPLSRAPEPRVAPPSSASRGGGGTGALPDYVFGESARPSEPITEGLPFGPGGGPETLSPPDPTDDMEVVLQGIIQLTGDQGIAQMLSEHREFKAWKTEREAPAPTNPMPQLAAVPEETPTDDFEPEVSEEFGLPEQIANEDLATEDAVAVEGEETADISVETPEAAPATPTEGPEVVA